MAHKLASTACLLLLGVLVGSTVAHPCGGSLEGNQGTLEYDDATDYDGGLTEFCIWTLRLHSLTDFQLQLQEIGGAGTFIGVFNKDSAQSAFPLVPPKFEFNSTSIGLDVRADGTELFLILRPSPTSRRFALTWQGSVPGSVVVESSSYLVSESGSVSVNNAGSQIVVFVLNPSSGRPKDVSARVVGFESGCAPALVFSIFQVTEAGHLREVTRTCGPPISIASMNAPLLAIVVKTSLLNSEVINFRWWSSELPPTPPPEPSTPSPGAGICGGVVSDLNGTVVYKSDDEYDAEENCVWVLETEAVNGRIQIQLTSDGFEDDAYLIITGLARTGANSNEYPMENLGRIRAGNRTVIDILGPVAYITFVSHSAGGQGFELEFTGSGVHPYFRASTTYHFTNPSGNLRYPASGNYRPTEIVAIVINPEATQSGGGSNLTLQIPFMNIISCTNCYCDVLEVHSVSRSTEVDVELRNRHCGNVPPEPITNGGPFLVVFRSNTATVAQGFQITYELN